MLICLFLIQFCAKNKFSLSVLRMVDMVLSVESISWTFYVPGKYEATKVGFGPYIASYGDIFVVSW